VSKYVKFTFERAHAEIAPFDQLAELNECRGKLRGLHLIGVYSNGIGFGNLSVRDGVTGNFYITGSTTGGLSKLTFADCVRIVEYDFKKNWVRYEGSAIPSSETLTHAAIYESDPMISAVIHCHDSVLWRALLDRAPTTSKAVTYGTPEMAYEIMRLFKEADVRTRNILVMAGHEGGLLAFGKNFEDAYGVLIRARELPQPCDAVRQYAGHSRQNARAPRQRAD
jgi:ribulose-5-phosphate 4-epimerase/fuculose-1-phosphate aldolase